MSHPEWRCKCKIINGLDKGANPNYVSACTLCGCKRPEPKVEPEEKWTIHLDKYERDNLLMLLRVIMTHEVAPFGIMNTGDWIGQIRWKLASKKQPDDTKETLRSNIDVKTLRERVMWWLEREKKNENDLMKDLVK